VTAAVHDTRLELAYAHCAAVTRTQASNFWYGIRLLPRVNRRALGAVYAFARRVDDIADGCLSDEAKLAELGKLRTQLRRLSTQPDDPVLLALADAARRLPIPLAAFDELIDGCEADVRGRRYATFDELVGYCRQVAGSIGRLSLGAFGAEGAAESSLADSLGIALQLTNILRDIGEDLRNGRVYLPAQDVERWCVRLDPTPGATVAGPPEAVARLVRDLAERAQAWYDDGLRLLPALDHRSAACCGAIAYIYHRLLQRIAADPGAVTHRRVSVPTWQKMAVAMRCLAGVRP
jgi:phytoene synthase